MSEFDVNRQYTFFFSSFWSLVSVPVGFIKLRTIFVSLNSSAFSVILLLFLTNFFFSVSFSSDIDSVLLCFPFQLLTIFAIELSDKVARSAHILLTLSFHLPFSRVISLSCESNKMFQSPYLCLCLTVFLSCAPFGWSNMFIYEHYISDVYCYCYCYTFVRTHIYTIYIYVCVY